MAAILPAVLPPVPPCDNSHPICPLYGMIVPAAGLALNLAGGAGDGSNDEFRWKPGTTLQSPGAFAAYMNEHVGTKLSNGDPLKSILRIFEHRKKNPELQTLLDEMLTFATKQDNSPLLSVTLSDQKQMEQIRKGKYPMLQRLVTWLQEHGGADFSRLNATPSDDMLPDDLKGKPVHKAHFDSIGHARGIVAMQRLWRRRVSSGPCEKDIRIHLPCHKTTHNCLISVASGGAWDINAVSAGCIPSSWCYQGRDVKPPTARGTAPQAQARRRNRHSARAAAAHNYWAVSTLANHGHDA
jgi:hypothetical protein